MDDTSNDAVFVDLDAADALANDTDTDAHTGTDEPKGKAPDGEAGADDAEHEGSDADVGDTDEDKPSTDDGDEEGSEDESDDDKPKRKRESGSQKWRRRALEAELRLQETERRPPAGDGASLEAAVEARIGPKPKETDPQFAGDYLAFERASTAWEAARLTQLATVRDEAQRAETRAKVERAEKLETYRERAAEVRKALPDYAEVMKSAESVMLADDVLELLVDSDKGPLLSYHLAKNPEIAARLNRMSPVAAAREIGRLEATVALPKPRTATKAPAPVSPLRGSAMPSRDPSKMSMADYVKYRNSGK